MTLVEKPNKELNNSDITKICKTIQRTNPNQISKQPAS